MLEWRHNSIPIQWQRYPVYLLALLCYQLVNAAVGETGEQIYKSYEWVNRPAMTTMLAGIAAVSFTVIYLILQIVTDLKLHGSPTPKVQ